CDILQSVLGRGAAVSRSDVDLLYFRALRQLPGERMLASARADHEQLHQWRKCRTPVNTIAPRRWSAALITSSSPTLPPRWITATAPASTTASRPSRNGKKASEATTEPFSERRAPFALSAAIFALSMRLICPAPTPSVAPPRQNTIAFDFTYFATVQAKSRSL